MKENKGSQPGPGSYVALSQTKQPKPNSVFVSGVTRDQ